MPNKKVLTIIGATVLILVVGFFIYKYVQTRNELARVKDQETASQNEAKELAGKLSKYLELPQNETPTIATITEKEKLVGQPFFNGAENGDKVLVYVTSEKAILYRPSTNKIISYAPVNLTGNESTTSQ